MKTEMRINNIGFTREEAEENVRRAEVEMGLLEMVLQDLVFYPKSFVQRRKIAGCEALLFVWISCGNVEEDTLVLGRSVEASIFFHTPDNRTRSAVGVTIFGKQFKLVTDVLAAFEGLVHIYQNEAKTLVTPVEPNYTKRNYDVLEDGISHPAQLVHEHCEVLQEALKKDREYALSFAPNEFVGEIVEEIDGLWTRVTELHTYASSHLMKAYNIIKRM